MEHVSGRTIGIEVQPDGTVATVMNDGTGHKVMDTDAEWRRQVGDRPALILARMLGSQVGWAEQYGADALLPTPEVLTALEART